MTGFDRITVVPNHEVDERRGKARADFEHACFVRYGYVPFSEEFFERSWPSGDDDAAVSEVRDTTGHEA